ncbi:hypothetical protein [Nocardia amamiensis]|uniref:hypothetical protein n=1 Tax=Nocardia amamiensis TaxID=404578 RepID=UPI00082C0E8A|nr:hypothetical protein [Nocardia amamiensis]
MSAVRGVEDLEQVSQTLGIFGYLRYPLVGQQRAEFVRAIEERAMSCGGPLRDVYFEAASPVAMLWTLLQGLDRDWGGDVVSAVTEYARADGVDVRDVLDGGRVAPVQWRALVAELDRLGGGWIIMPSPRDLDGLGEPRHVVLQRLAAMNVHVAYLRGGASAPEPGQRRAPALVSEGTEIGQFRVSAFGLAIEVAKLSAQMYLNRAGLAYLVDAVTDLLGDLIGRRVEDTLVPGRTNEMTVQLLRRSDSLVVVVSETHDHLGEPVSATARAVCGLDGVEQAQAPDGGTVTRYRVALTEPVAFESAAIRRPA